VFILKVFKLGIFNPFGRRKSWRLDPLVQWDYGTGLKVQVMTTMVIIFTIIPYKGGSNSTWTLFLAYFPYFEKIKAA
jgi:hypothetical protein